MQTAIPIRTVGGFITVGAEIAGTQEPDAGKGAIQFIDQPLGNGGEYKLKIKTGSHLERDLLQRIVRSWRKSRGRERGHCMSSEPAYDRPGER
jgi:hypothetical protein